MDKIKDQINNNYTEVVKEYVKSIEAMGIPVEKSYIFGSRIRGNHHKDSDLDVCIVSPAFGLDSKAEWIFLTGLAHKVADIIEPHSFSPYEFDNKYNLLAREIKRTGIEVA